jgi:negative regulator of flagellin synthesis FlgM
MNNTILNNGLPKYPQPTVTSGGSANSAATPAAAPGAVGAPTGDQVKLTDSALVLQQAARSDQASPIDSKRVEQIRQALADGSYTVSPGRIADRMLAMDSQMGGTGKA